MAAQVLAKPLLEGWQPRVVNLVLLARGKENLDKAADEVTCESEVPAPNWLLMVV